jgi:Protein similar to CwfJ C-terminus 2/Protein similar to CwfJ C-terminus 1
MLSAIKTGKKKKKSVKTSKTAGADDVHAGVGAAASFDHGTSATVDIVSQNPKPSLKPPPPAAAATINDSTIAVTTTSSSIMTNNKNNDKNLSVAEQLRRALSNGGAIPPPSVPRTTSSSSTTKARQASSTLTSSELESDSNVVVLPQTNFLPVEYRKSTQNKLEHEMTVTELAARERAGANSNTGMSWDEEMARNVIRTNKKRKMKMSKHYQDGDSDEEVERMKRHLPGGGYYDQQQDGDNGGRHGEAEYSAAKLSTKSSRREQEQKQREVQRQQRRQIDQYRKEQSVTTKCYWWVSSSHFAKHRLVAFGQHTALMMAPLSSSLVEGNHFYISTIKHSPSMVECSDYTQVQDEIQLFRQSLENVYARQGKGIVMIETVLPSKSSGGFWQTKLDVVPVPFGALQDAPLYFKSSMTEQAEEWGTHNKILTVSNPSRSLRSVIPSGFPYFACDWGNLASSRDVTGYAQIIESSSFRSDFGLDTLASMMELDPVRFKNKQQNMSSKSVEEKERHLLEEFLPKWKPFDWTERLDDANE